MYLTTMKRATPVSLPRYIRSFSNIFDYSSAQQTKNEIASDILENIPSMRRRQIVKLSSVFPKMTDAMKAEDSVIEDVYYDDLSFKECVIRARSSTELTALGIGPSVGGVLDVLASKPSDFEVHVVNYVVIQRVGRHVVKLRNKTSETTAGRCLFLDLTGLRHTAASEESIHFARDTFSRKTSAVNWIAVFTVVMSLAPAVIKAFH